MEKVNPSGDKFVCICKIYDVKPETLSFIVNFFKLIMKKRISGKTFFMVRMSVIAQKIPSFEHLKSILTEAMIKSINYKEVTDDIVSTTMKNIEIFDITKSVPVAIYSLEANDPEKLTEKIHDIRKSFKDKCRKNVDVDINVLKGYSKIIVSLETNIFVKMNKIDLKDLLIELEQEMHIMTFLFD